MFSKLFSIVLPGPTLPTATSEPSEDEFEVANLRGPSEHGKKHLPDITPLFLPPPFTPSHVVFSHFSAVATEQSQKLRDEAEEAIAQVTEQKVAEVRKAEAALKQEVKLVWNRFRDSLKLYEQTGPSGKASLSLRRRGSVSRHARSVSSPIQGTSGSVRITNFVPTPSQSTKSSPNRLTQPSALSASLKVSGMHYPGAQRQFNGNGNLSPSRGSPTSPPSDRGRSSPEGSSITCALSPSTASSRTAALSIDAETSIRGTHRREMNEAKDIATSFRYVLDLEAQMEQQRLQAEVEIPSSPVASGSKPPAEKNSPTVARTRPSRVQRSAIKTSTTDRLKSPQDNSKEDTGSNEQKEAEADAKGKRKVTFDVKPEVAIIKDEGEIISEQPTPLEVNEGRYILPTLGSQRLRLSPRPHV